jgi:outer membrane autotransporter protein
VRATGFLSTKLNNRWYLDAGLSAGFGDYTTQRNTVTGRATGSTSGFDVGANVFTGTIVVLREDLHLTPFAGLSYAHHEFSGFTEKGGNGSALKVDGWSNDSLRASVGTGLGWWLPAGDWKWKLGVDVAYNHELLDDESDIDAAFVSGGSKFSTAAAALPADSLSVGPNAALHFDENNALSAGVNFEYGFDGRTYTGFNVAFRRRF